MRWMLLGLLGTVGLMDTAAYGQKTPPLVFQQLEKHRIYLDKIYVNDKVAGTMASVDLGNSETLQGLQFLHEVRDLARVELEFRDGKNSDECLKKIGELRGLKDLQIRTNRFTENDLKRILALTHLESISLDCNEISDAQIRQLHALNDSRNLKQLRLSYVEASPKALEELKGALTQVKDIHIERDMFTVQLLKISPKDDQITKLQKEKFNAAASGYNVMNESVRAGQKLRNDPVVRPYAERLRDAAAELNDPEIQLRFADSYVAIQEAAYKEAERASKAGVIRPEGFYEARYLFLDAQLYQLRLKKQLEKK